MSPVLVDYSHFLGIASRLEWDERRIDLGADARAWPRLDRARRERVIAFAAAFALAEERVAVDLEPFIAAAPNREMAACFRAQGRDEDRHARFFERYARGVLRVGDPGEHVSPRFTELFEERLSATARELASGRLALADAVALYHLLLEGVVFSAGQSALLAELTASGELPGLLEGLQRVVADERWHIGLGVRVLRDHEPGDSSLAPGAAERAVDAWGELLPPDQRDAALRLHRRRLSAAGIGD